MDYPNVLIGQKTPPTESQVSECLGQSLQAWNELLNWLESKGIAAGEWKSASPEYGGGLRPALGKRTILYLGPCQNCFRVSLVLGDKALAVVQASDLPKKLLKEIAQTKRYAEGTGVRIFVAKPSDLSAVRTLVQIKLAS